MALNLGFKINRFLYLTRQKLLNIIYPRPYSQKSKSRCRNFHIKSANTLKNNQTDSISMPEPSLPSETASDDEKARPMTEQVRFHLQMQQEMLLKHNMQNSNAGKEPFPSIQEEEEYEDAYEQPNYPQREQQTNDRKPKRDKDLMQHDQTKEQQPMEAAKKGIDSAENTAEDLDNRRPPSSHSRKRKNTRAARYLRHSWYPRHVRKQISRQYSTCFQAIIAPEIISQSEKCDRLIKHLKSLYPEYRNMTKPLLIPGSDEENEFIKTLLKQIAKHKSQQNSIKKTSAPFPSYSDITTFRCDNDNKTAEVTHKTYSRGSHKPYSPKKQRIRTEISSKLREPVIKVNSKTKLREPLNKVNSKTQLIRQLVNKVSSKTKLRKPVNKVNPEPKLWDLENKVNPKFIFKDKKIISAPKKPELRKEEAPYPSYSEVQENHIDETSSSNRFNIDQLLLRSQPDNKCYYCTAPKDSTTVEKPATKKPSCNEETARKKQEKKNCLKNDKKCNQENEEFDSVIMINKIKEWLNSYKPNAQNIKISRSPEDIDGRETYVIEVNEMQEIKPGDPEMLLMEKQEEAPDIVEIVQPNHSNSVFPNRGSRRIPFKNMEYQSIGYVETHVPEMSDPIPVLTRNIPQFTSPEIEKTLSKPGTAPCKIKSRNSYFFSTPSDSAMIEKFAEKIKKDKVNRGKKFLASEQNAEKVKEKKDSKGDFVARGDEKVNVEEKYNNSYFNKPGADEIIEKLQEQIKKVTVNRVKKFLASEQELEKVKEKNDSKFDSVARADEELKDNNHYSSKLIDDEMIEKIAEQINKDKVNRVKKFLLSEQEAQKAKIKAQVNKIKDYTLAKQRYEKVEIKTKEDRLNKLREAVKEEIQVDKIKDNNVVKQRYEKAEIIAKDRLNKLRETVKEEIQVNKIKDYTVAKQRYAKAEINKVNKLSNSEKVKEETQVNKIKAETRTKEGRVKSLSDFVAPKKKENKANTLKADFKQKQTPQNQSYQASPSEMQKSFADLKDLNDLQPRPVFMSKKPGPPKSRKGGDCDNKHIKDGCTINKIEEDNCPPKPCRPKKKRKVPKCDDVKGNVNCLPIYNYIPGLEHKPQFALNPPKKTYFINNKITENINLKSEEIKMLSNRNFAKEDEFVPFKLKPQFRK